MLSRKIASGTGLVFGIILFIASVVLVNSLFTSLRIDLTENKLFTLSDGTINIIENLDEPIQLKFYFSQNELTSFNPAMLNYGVRVRDLLEEYAAKSNGNVQLTITDPEPFSEEEDEAVGYGLQGIQVNTAGDRAYFGLFGSNSTDDEEIIPLFQADKQASLEYDISKLIYGLAYPKKPLVGVISSLPILGNEQANLETWTIVKNMYDFFDIENISPKADEINPDIDVLMIVHPKDLKEPILYAIDQFLLHGGKAMVFLDPLAEGDSSQPPADNPNVMPDLDSDLDHLFKIWGIEVLKEKIAGDSNAAMRVQSRTAKGPEEVTYLPWLSLGKENFNQDDFTTNNLNVLNMGTVGIIQKREDAEINITPLIQTTLQSMRMERDLILFQRDPKVMMDNFKSEERKQTLVARISGKVSTAFPEGKPNLNDDENFKPDENFRTEGEINMILAADTDILRDLFWIREQNMFGMSIPQPIANNGDFIINSIDNLSGNTDLISLRSRGIYSRPFEKVETIRREAESKFREREQQLLAKLKETEEKIQQIQTQQGEENVAVLSKAQNEEIEKFRMERVKTRKELRSVQHDLKKNIERLGNQLRFINIGLIPLLIIVFSIGLALLRNRKAGL